jgi:hypothetical protein
MHAINTKAAQNLKDIFGEDLRQQRKRRASKYAFASPRKLEWYLDEKVHKSESARTHVLNEVLKKMGDIYTPE